MYLQTRSIKAFIYISKLASSRPPSLSADSLGYNLHVRTFMASKFVSKLARSRSPRAFLSFPDLSPQVNLQTRSITASKCISQVTQSVSPSACHKRLIKYIFKERQRLYGDTGVTEVDRVTGSIYSADRSLSRYSVCRLVSPDIACVDG
jgi:hypothetical protein